MVTRYRRKVTVMTSIIVFICFTYTVTKALVGGSSGCRETCAQYEGPSLFFWDSCCLELQPVQQPVMPKDTCLLDVLPENYMNSPLSSEDLEIPPNITIVTAYFNIGEFLKGDDIMHQKVIGSRFYMHTALMYAHLQNPVVFYTDSDEFAKHFSKIRKHLKNMTKIVKIDRKNVWAFDYLDRIKEILSEPNYPKFYPNTVVPEYSCSQHAKYSCMEKAINSDYFKTKYYAWLDMGYFRFVQSRRKDFRIVLPRYFDPTRVALNEVNCRASMEESPEHIFKNNRVWVGGGLVLGTRRVLNNFINEYRIALERYLTMNLVSTDQQVLFAMSTKSEQVLLKPSVKIQQFYDLVTCNCWFYLGWLCYKEY